MQQRNVIIRHVKNTWLVEYVKPRRNERRFANRFADDVRSYEDVVQWVQSNPTLRLVDEDTFTK